MNNNPTFDPSYGPTATLLGSAVGLLAIAVGNIALAVGFIGAIALGNFIAYVDGIE